MISKHNHSLHLSASKSGTLGWVHCYDPRSVPAPREPRRDALKGPAATLAGTLPASALGVSSFSDEITTV